MEQQQQWRKLNGQRLKQPIVDEVRAAIVREKQMGHELKVCIGTDSQVKGKETDIAYELCRIFTLYNVDMEVHADINTNPNFKSNDALKEAMGYIMGMGFAFKAKPDAFASSSCANKVVQ